MNFLNYIFIFVVALGLYRRLLDVLVLSQCCFVDICATEDAVHFEA